MVNHIEYTLMSQSFLNLHFNSTKSTQKRLSLEDKDLLKKSLKLETPQVHKLKTLITPISSIPSLSKSTSDLISSFQIQRPSTTAEEILCSIPAKEKYAELLDPLRTHPLPYPYKKLLNFLDALDKSLNYCFLISQQATVQFLSFFMLDKYKIPFCVDMLAQLQYLCGAYRVHFADKQENWVVGIEGGGESLGTELILRRKDLVYRGLMRLTEKCYGEFCKERGIEGYTRSWHPDFDLQGVCLVPKANMCKEQVRSILNSEVVARNPAVGAVFSEMISENGEAFLKPQEKSEDVQVRIQKNRNDRKKDCERVLSICESLKVLFTGMKTPSIFLINLCKKLQESGFEGQLTQDISFIHELFPEWFTIIPTNSGKVLRHSRQCSLTLKKIQETVQNSFDALI